MEYPGGPTLTAQENDENDEAIKDVLPEGWSKVIFSITADGGSTARYWMDPWVERTYGLEDPFDEYLLEKDTELTALARRLYPT